MFVVACILSFCGITRSPMSDSMGMYFKDQCSDPIVFGLLVSQGARYLKPVA